MPYPKGRPRPPNSGRRKGTQNKGTIRARRLISEAADKEIVDKVVKAAKAGDPHATLVYFRYLRPRPPQAVTDKPFNLEQPQSAQEARDAIAKITSMIARAEIDGEHGSRVISGLEAYLGAKIAELEAKVQAMIDARKGNGFDEGSIEIAPEDLEQRIINLKPNGPQQ